MCFPSLRDPSPMLPISWGEETASYVLASFTAVDGRRSTLELLLWCGWKWIINSLVTTQSIHTVAARSDFYMQIFPSC